MKTKKYPVPRFAMSVSVLSLLMGLPAAASEGPSPDLNALLKTVVQQKEKLVAQEAELEAQKRALRELQAQMRLLSDSVLDSQRAMGAGKKEERAQGDQGKSAIAKKQTATDKDKHVETVGLDRKPEEKDRPPEIPALADEAGVLLAPGKLVIEPSLEYSRSSAVRVAVEGFTIIPALNIGSFEITEVDRDTATAATTFRLGLTKRFEAEVRVPYVYRNDSTLSRPIGTGAGADISSEVDAMGLGDIEVAGHYQINNGQNGWPFFIANLRFKSRTGTDPFEVPTDPATGLQTELPTGSGFYALQPSVTAIFPSDPVVFYGSLGYLYNMARNVSGTVGEIDPGDSINLGFGMGFSVNEKASFSLGYTHDAVLETTQNGSAITNSKTLQIGSLNLGFAYRLNEMTNLNFNVSAGLTDDAPDVRLIFRVPLRFNLY